MRANALVGIAGTTCSVVALLSICVSLATDHWVEATVNRPAMVRIAANDVRVAVMLAAPHRLYVDRYRGVFRTCYRDAALACEGDRAFTARNDSGTNASAPNAYAESRTHLVRAQLSLLLLGVLLASVSFSCLVVSRLRRFRHGRLLRAALACGVVAALCVGAAIALFHVVVDYLERNKLDSGDVYPAGWRRLAQHQRLATFTRFAYGYSYYVAWTAFVLQAAVCVLLVRDVRNAPKRDNCDSIVTDETQRNTAYDMMERQTSTTLDADDTDEIAIRVRDI